MPGDNPEIELEKLPIPVPSVVLELAVVGFCVILQQTPRAVTDAPPSLVIFPPPVIVVAVTADSVVVVMVGKIVTVVVVT